ncbi:hypothetical protein GLOIN_2v1486855 [Rhizophagus clarus]|uniref:Uncharacterized protein n=1 Tax=Rhizophagus clarus TaxID=94130 RepID=A0A8H3MA88_9GLOM|nr:hypothetical protein GLOIN_2v1486855 [Rhizophagus clarus]
MERGSALKFLIDICDVNTISDSNSSHEIPFNILTIGHLKKMIYLSIPTREKNGKYDKIKEDPRLKIVKKELEGEELNESWNVVISFSDIRMEHIHVIIQPGSQIIIIEIISDYGFKLYEIIEIIKKDARKLDISKSPDKIYMPLQQCGFELAMNKIRQTTNANIDKMEGNSNYWCLISTGAPGIGIASLQLF